MPANFQEASLSHAGRSAARNGITLLTGQFVYTIDIASDTTDQGGHQNAVTVPGFDSGVGTLDSIEIHMKFNGTKHNVLESLVVGVPIFLWVGAAPPPYLGGPFDGGPNFMGMSLFRSDGTTAVGSISGMCPNIFGISQTGYDGLIDYAGPGSVSIDVGASNDNQGAPVATLTSSGDKTYFTSASPIALKMTRDSTYFWGAAGTQNYAFLDISKVGGTITIVYNYH